MGLITTVRRLFRRKSAKEQVRELERRLGLDNPVWESILQRLRLDAMRDLVQFESLDYAREENRQYEEFAREARAALDRTEMQNQDGTWKVPILTLYRRYCDLYEHVHQTCGANKPEDPKLMQLARDTLPLKPLTYEDLIYRETGKYPPMRIKEGR